jgi:hypothetical protein
VKKVKYDLEASKNDAKHALDSPPPAIRRLGDPKIRHWRYSRAPESGDNSDETHGKDP